MSVEVTLKRAGISDAEQIWRMQVEAFADMYSRYGDTETSPAAEQPDKTAGRLGQPFTSYYFILADGEKVGAVRVVDHGKPDTPKRISPIFILPGHRGSGIGEAAVREVERIHGATGWELDTILEEESNVRFYSRLGYTMTDEKTRVNDRMTLVIFRK